MSHTSKCKQTSRCMTEKVQNSGNKEGKERFPRKDQELAWLQMTHSNTSKQDNGGIHSEFWEKITSGLDSTPNSIMIYNNLEKSRSSHIQTFKIQKMVHMHPYSEVTGG